MIAFSLGSHEQSLTQLGELAQFLVQLAGEDIIIQADGNPISGRKGKQSTLPCLELANYLLHTIKLPTYVQVSGGTNHLTGRLDRERRIPIHGIGMGSFARKHLDLKPSDLLSSIQLEQSILRAKELVLSV